MRSEAQKSIPISMDRVFSYIHKLQGYPEPKRRRILWIFVVSCCVVIGTLWAITLPWQLSRSSHTTTKADVVDAGNLPPIGESIANAGASVGDAARSMLRRMLLGDEQTAQGVLNDTVSENTSPPPRLPHSE